MNLGERGRKAELEKQKKGEPQSGKTQKSKKWNKERSNWGRERRLSSNVDNKLLQSLS